MLQRVAYYGEGPVLEITAREDDVRAAVLFVQCGFGLAAVVGKAARVARGYVRMCKAVRNHSP